ncbi:MAG: hypothetical protein E7240_04930 [Lachnospiraceae bacterium]|nr:hypothetical protein [Lachnospiraceae bacterium]
MIKKAGKGQAGYISYERFRRIVRTVILFLIPFAAFTVSLIYYGTRQNIITVVSMIGMIPACMSAVSVVMVFTIRSIPKDTLKRIEERAGDLAMAYELYMTNYDKNTLLDAVAVCGDTIVALATYKKPDRKEAEAHMLKMIRAAGFRANVTVMDNESKFLERLTSLSAHAADIRSGILPRKDSRYPEDSYEEQLIHILMTASL